MREKHALALYGVTGTLASAGLLVLLACGTPDPQTVTKTFSDAQACGVGVVAATEGVVDVADLLRCGLSLLDAYALVKELLAATQTDAKAALAPSRAAYVQHLQRWKAALEAAGAK